MSEGKTVAAVFICILALHLLFLYGYQLDNRPQRPRWQAEPDTPLFTIKVVGDEKQSALIVYHLATKNFYWSAYAIFTSGGGNLENHRLF